MNIIVKESFLFQLTRYRVFVNGNFVGKASAMGGVLSISDVNIGSLVEIKNIRNRLIDSFTVTDSEETVLISRKHYFYYFELAVFVLFGLFSGLNVSHESNLLYAFFLLLSALIMLGLNLYSMMRPLEVVMVKRLSRVEL